MSQQGRGICQDTYQRDTVALGLVLLVILTFSSLGLSCNPDFHNKSTSSKTCCCKLEILKFVP